MLHSKWSMQCWNKMSNHREKIALVNCKYALEHNCFVNTLSVVEILHVKV